MFPDGGLRRRATQESIWQRLVSSLQLATPLLLAEDVRWLGRGVEERRKVALSMMRNAERANLINCVNLRKRRQRPARKTRNARGRLRESERNATGAVGGFKAPCSAAWLVAPTKQFRVFWGYRLVAAADLVSRSRLIMLGVLGLRSDWFCLGRVFGCCLISYRLFETSSPRCSF